MSDFITGLLGASSPENSTTFFPNLLFPLNRRAPLRRHKKDLTVYRSINADANALNVSLHASGMLPGASISDEDFDRLRSAPKALLDSELDAILSAYGYEAYFNPELILSGAIPVASHLLALQWEFLHSTDPAFILTDRPVPIQIGDGFRIGLSACFSLILSKPTGPIDQRPIQARWLWVWYGKRKLLK